MGRLSLLALTLALTGAIFAASEVSPDAANGLGLLYVLPIALATLEFGLVSGLAMALAAMVLVGVWDGTTDGDLTPLAYVGRAGLFLGAMWLSARMAARLRRLARDGDRYFELGEDLICTGRLDGTLTRVNQRWTEVLGWTAEELNGHNVLEFVHPGDRDRLTSVIAATVQSGDAPVGLVHRMLTKDGGFREFDWSVSISPDGDMAYGAARDVTDRRRLERGRRAAQERLHAAFDDAMTGMAVVGLRGEEAGIVLESNAAMAEILGVPRQEMLGTFSFGTYLHPDDIQAMTEKMQPLSDGEVDVVNSEARIVRPDGQVRWLQVRTSALHDEDGQPQYRLSQALDVTDIKTNEDQLRHLADHDPLSWLFNRRRFLDELAGELTAGELRSSRGAALVIDLDNFKQVNDVSGHAVGDEVIRTVSLALIRRLRSGDVAGRLGGDEFGVLLRRVSGEEAVLVSHDLLEVVSDALASLGDDMARRVTLSVGIALIDESQRDADHLLARADAAMYDAKREGGGRVALATALAGRA